MARHLHTFFYEGYPSWSEEQRQQRLAEWLEAIKEQVSGRSSANVAETLDSIYGLHAPRDRARMVLALAHH